MNAAIAEQLVREGKSKIKGCYSQRTGKHYDAVLVMATDDTGRAVFSMEFENGGKRK